MASPAQQREALSSLSTARSQARMIVRAVATCPGGLIVADGTAAGCAEDDGRLP
jgi:hypothetical protein